MRVQPTAEMLALKKIYKPYYKDGDLISDAPKEAKEAREKYLILFKENYDYWKKIMESE